MLTLEECFHSVTDIAFLWSLSLTVIVGVTTWLVSSRRWLTQPTKLFTSQRGAAYTLSVVVALPFYILLIATVIECTMLLVVKLGTMHAAFAAARAAVVWLPAEVTDEQRLTMIHWAPAQGIAPFASASEEHLEAVDPAFSWTPTDDLAYESAIDALTAISLPAGYLANKRKFALAATTVKIEVDEFRSPSRLVSPDGRVEVAFVGNSPQAGRIAAHADVTVTVSYEKPIDVPGVGVFLGKVASWAGARFYSRKISSTVTLEKEGPKSRQQTLGISYNSWGF